MDPEDRTTHLFAGGDLVQVRDLRELETPEGPLPFSSQALLALLDEEGA